MYKNEQSSAAKAIKNCKFSKFFFTLFSYDPSKSNKQTNKLGFLFFKFLLLNYQIKSSRFDVKSSN